MISACVGLEMNSSSSARCISKGAWRPSTLAEILLCVTTVVGDRSVNAVTHGRTSPEMDKMVAERYKLMTPDRRMRIASSMFETARAIIESSMPLNLTRRERRLALAKRLYAGELPDAALLAFAEWQG